MRIQRYTSPSKLSLNCNCCSLPDFNDPRSQDIREFLLQTTGKNSIAKSFIGNTGFVM